MNDPVARSALGLHTAPVTIAHVEAIPVKLPLSRPVVCVVAFIALRPVAPRDRFRYRGVVPAGFIVLHAVLQHPRIETRER